MQLLKVEKYLLDFSSRLKIYLQNFKRLWRNHSKFKIEEVTVTQFYFENKVLLMEFTVGIKQNNISTTKIKLQHLRTSFPSKHKIKLLSFKLSNLNPNCNVWRSV